MNRTQLTYEGLVKTETFGDRYMTKEPTKFFFSLKRKLSAILHLPHAFLGWILRFLFPFFDWNLQAMPKILAEDILERVWSNSGDEEDDLDDEWADESDEDYFDESESSEREFSSSSEGEP